MLYCRLYVRGHWGVTHLTPAGIKTLCGRVLATIQGDVEISNRAGGRILCGSCRKSKTLNTHGGR